MASSLVALLAAIPDTDSPLPVDDLCQLSDMPADSAAALEETWPTIDLHRRREVMRHLAEICQTNFVVDFSPIALLGLQDQDGLVRLAAVNALWDAEAPALVAPLLRMMQHDPEVAVQAGAAQALGQFVFLGELGDLPGRLFDQLAGALLTATKDPDTPLLVRCRALEALAAGCLAEVPGLINDAYRSEEEALQISAIAAMGRTADPCWEPAILAELDSVIPSMRYHAAQAAGSLELPAAVPQLARLLDDPDPQVTVASTWSLGEIGGAEARAALETVLDDGELGALAEEALGITEIASAMLINDTEL